MKTGYHKAKALFGALGFTSKGGDQVAVEFEITDGECKGEHVTWFGYFTDASADRTIESLRHCGWTGDDLDNLVGLGSSEVSLDVGEEDYEGKPRLKVKWVNAIGGAHALKQAMTDIEARSFAQRMKGRVIAQRAKGGAPPNGTRGTQARQPPPGHASDAPPHDDSDAF